MLLKKCLEVRESIICFKLYYITNISFGYCDTDTFICNSLITSQIVWRPKKEKKKRKKEGKKKRREGGRERGRKEERKATF